MRTDLFDFELPESAIALEPATPRDSARLLVVPPDRSAPFDDRIIRDLASLLRPDDVLVLNDTRVIPAALEGMRKRGDGPSARVAFNLIKRIDESRWRAFARPAKRLDVGDRIRFGHDGDACLLGRLEATVTAKLDAGEVELAFDLHGAYLDDAIDAIGTMPLPPYIALKRDTRPEDADHYQTVFARKPGAVAAPTAGLHLTETLLGALSARGIEQHFVTLHVGAGTFLPVKSDDTSDHKMHSEWGEVSAATAAALNGARSNGRRIVSIGTTALRILESAARPDGTIMPFAGETSIFITPGYRFRAVDVLLTNFHLPRSTLFMLVAAFAGLDRMKQAYAHALAAGYRFFSYGDATLLTRAPSVPDQVTPAVR